MIQRTIFIADSVVPSYEPISTVVLAGRKCHDIPMPFAAQCAGIQQRGFTLQGYLEDILCVIVGRLMGERKKALRPMLGVEASRPMSRKRFSLTPD